MRSGYLAVVIWGQSFAALVVWLAYGWQQGKGQDALRARLNQRSRTQLVRNGSLGFIFSAVILLSGLWAIASAGGLTPNGLTVWGWVAVVLVGLVFVHFQVLAAASMITLVQQSETTTPVQPSDPQPPDHSDPT